MTTTAPDLHELISAAAERRAAFDAGEAARTDRQKARDRILGRVAIAGALAASALLLSQQVFPADEDLLSGLSLLAILAMSVAGGIVAVPRFNREPARDDRSVLRAVSRETRRRTSTDPALIALTRSCARDLLFRLPFFVSTVPYFMALTLQRLMRQSWSDDPIGVTLSVVMLALALALVMTIVVRGYRARRYLRHADGMSGSIA